MDEKALEKKLKQLKIAATERQSDTGCVPCDLAVAASMISNCCPDKDKGEKNRERYITGELTLNDIFKDMDATREGCKYVSDFIKDKFKYAMDLKFTDFEEKQHEI